MTYTGHDSKLFMSVGLIMPRLMPNLCHWLTQALAWGLNYFIFFPRCFLFSMAPFELLLWCFSNIPAVHIQLLKKIPSAEFSPSVTIPTHRTYPLLFIDSLWWAALQSWVQLSSCTEHLEVWEKESKIWWWHMSCRVEEQEGLLYMYEVQTSL